MGLGVFCLPPRPAPPVLCLVSVRKGSLEEAAFSQAGDVEWVGRHPCVPCPSESSWSQCVGYLVLHGSCSVNPCRPSCTKGGFGVFLKWFLSPSEPPRTKSSSLSALHLQLKTVICVLPACAAPCLSSPPPRAPSVLQVSFCPPHYRGLEPSQTQLDESSLIM